LAHFRGTAYLKIALTASYGVLREFFLTALLLKIREAANRHFQVRTYTSLARCCLFLKNQFLKFIVLASRQS
jgi:hypothetical protein